MSKTLITYLTFQKEKYQCLDKVSIWALSPSSFQKSIFFRFSATEKPFKAKNPHMNSAKV